MTTMNAGNSSMSSTPAVHLSLSFAESPDSRNTVTTTSAFSESGSFWISTMSANPLPTATETATLSGDLRDNSISSSESEEPNNSAFISLCHSTPPQFAPVGQTHAVFPQLNHWNHQVSQPQHQWNDNWAMHFQARGSHDAVQVAHSSITSYGQPTSIRYQSPMFQGREPSLLPPPVPPHRPNQSASAFQSSPQSWTNVMSPKQTMTNSMLTETNDKETNGRAEGDEERDGGSRRKNITRENTRVLKSWLNNHLSNPYPNKGEKIMLAIITRMSVTQVSTWFANARRRLKKDNQIAWAPGNRSLSGLSPPQTSQSKVEQHYGGNVHERIPRNGGGETGMSMNRKDQEQPTEDRTMPSFPPLIPQSWHSWEHESSSVGADASSLPEPGSRCVWPLNNISGQLKNPPNHQIGAPNILQNHSNSNYPPNGYPR